MPLVCRECIPLSLPVYPEGAAAPAGAAASGASGGAGSRRQQTIAQAPAHAATVPAVL